MLALLALASGVFAADLPAKFDPSRDAAADVAHACRAREGARQARDRRRRRRMVRVVPHHGPLHRGERRRAGAIDAHYVWVKVNFSKQNANEALLSRWPKVAGYPHLFVLDADGDARPFAEHRACSKRGKSYDKARFLAFLDRWAPAKSRSALPRVTGPVTGSSASPRTSSDATSAFVADHAGRLIPLDRFAALPSAQATCSRTSADGSSARAAQRATIAGSGAALPSATAMLREPALVADAADRAAFDARSELASRPGEERRRARRRRGRCAPAKSAPSSRPRERFHGHASWQSSQP